MSTSLNLSLVEMLEAGVHFGHKTAKRHPKMQPFIFGSRNGIAVLDLEQTKIQLEAVLPVVEDMAANQKTILFLGTKRQAQAIIKAAAERVAAPYIIERWLGGLLTNYSHVSNLMRNLTRLKQERDTGAWNERYTKKEQLLFEREIEQLEKLIGGVETMTKLPDAIFIIDCKKEKTAVKEANRMHIPIIALVDTNVNPTKIAYPIPANDDGIKSIQYIVDQVVGAIQRGQARVAVSAPPVVVVNPA